MIDLEQAKQTCHKHYEAGQRAALNPNNKGLIVDDSVNPLLIPGFRQCYLEGYDSNALAWLCGYP